MFSRRVDCTAFQLTFALVCIFARPVFPYVVPDLTFEVLKPQGLRVSIPDAPGLKIFGFHANINKAIRRNELGEITGDVYLARNGRWTFVNEKATIQNGNVLHYWIYIQVNEDIYRKINQKWTYSPSENQALDNQGTTWSSTSRNEIPNAGQLLFEDNFNYLNESLWIREIKMSHLPDYEFCVYHNKNHLQLVQIDKGKLIIRPLILEDLYGENSTKYGTLQLNGCTSMFPHECSRHALSYAILPPIISARLTTKKRFSFQYGKIEIRAKFPQGDWLYPEMWLDSKYSLYGLNYTGGRVLLGLARGNANLVNATDASKIYDLRRLDFGVRVGISPKIHEILVSKIDEFGTRWAQDFHVYTTVWTSDGFTFFVDGMEVGRLSPDEKGWMDYPIAERKAAPFDQKFYITLGVGAGGVRVFPDGIISSGFAKPWQNMAPQAMLNFWKSRNHWLPSWREDGGEKTAFAIDYVRVWSL